jgi:hypothetical protein
MNLVARMLFWSSATASVAAVVWYSYELTNNGYVLQQSQSQSHLHPFLFLSHSLIGYILYMYSTDPHLIAWFSAGAFVLLGFPISMYGIVMHLANYNQPNVQCYIVRILWMVPLYSIESWLCLRYKDYAIYIETLRDLYESYVLYSFLQFLIQVLGGEESLILMLKDKSPTRGVHMWGLQWCGVKPWLMGQPIRKTYDSQIGGDDANTTNTTNTANTATSLGASQASSPQRPLKRVYWTSPFFVKCKFGVLQYVLLKFVCSIVVMILERNHMYKEGDFTPKGGYLYICILTNLSQCWALYCLIFFYYATKNELASIRPVGKFLSVKALVFFTWWQSVCISMLYQMDLIPHYHSSGGAGMAFGGDYAASEYLPLSEEDALALDELGGGSGVVLPASATISSSSSATLVTEWSAEDVAKGLQDYLICIEMFVAAIVHLFVFSHTEYDPQAVEARTRALNQTPHKDWNKRLGRKWKEWDNKSGWSGTTHTSSEIELNIFHKDNSNTAGTSLYSNSNSVDEDDLRIHPLDRLDEEIHQERRPLLALEPVQSEGELEMDEDDGDDDEASVFSMESSELNDDDDSYEGDIEEPRTPPPTKPAIRKPGFVKALLDSAIPQDLRDNTVGIIKGDYVVEKKTLLHHAATSDSYDLFSRVIKPSRSTATSKSSVD